MTNVFTSDALAAMLRRIEPWPSWPSAYTAQSWGKLITVAQDLQNYSPNSIQDVLRWYEESWELVNVDTYEARIKDDSKLLLLMRVVFDLPENAPSMQKYFPWSLNGTEVNEDDSVNMGWPISWKAGKPRLVSGVTSIQGVVGGYHVAKEYDFMLRHCGFRKL
jgi:hypothetical protein